MKEMVGGCCVCSDDRGWAENPLVYCDGQGCTVAVHQACYGIVTVPTGNWYCRRCESQERSARAVCYICEESGKGSRATVGACMQCNKSGCKQQFHVTCAQALGLLCEEAGNYLDNVKYCGYCQHHYSKLKKGGNVKTIPPYRPIPTDNGSDSSSPEKEGSEGWGKQSGKRKLSSSSKSSLLTTNSAKSISSAKSGTASPSTIEPIPVVEEVPVTTVVSLQTLSQSKDVIAPSVAPKTCETTSSGSGGKFTTSNFVESVVTPSESVFGDSSKSGKKRKGLGKDEPSVQTSAIVSTNTVLANSQEDPNKRVKLETAVPVKAEASTPSVVVKLPGSVTPSTSPSSTPSATRNLTTTSPLATTSSIVVSVPLTAATLPPNAVTTAPTPPSTPVEEVPVKRGRSQSSDKSEKGRKQKRGGGGGGGSGGKRGARNSQATPPPPPPTTVQQPVQNSVPQPPPLPPPPPTSTTISVVQPTTVSTPPIGVKDSPPSSPESSKRSCHKSRKQTPVNDPVPKKEEKDVKLFQNGVSAPHMLGNQLNPASTMAQKMSDTLSQEMSEAHSIFSTADSNSASGTQLIGPQLHSRVIACARSSNSSANSTPQSSTTPPTSNSGNPNSSGSMWGSQAGVTPQTLDQLLERQWEQGSQFLMEQAQHFDIASLLSCLHQLRAENLRLEEHVSSLLQRRDHLLAVNARLAIPLIPTTPVNNIHPSTSSSAVQQASAIEANRTSAAQPNRLNNSYMPQAGTTPVENGPPASPPTQSYHRSSSGGTQPSPNTLSRHHSPGNTGYVMHPQTSVPAPGVVVQRSSNVAADTLRTDARRSNSQASTTHPSSYSSMYQVSSQQSQIVMRRDVNVNDHHHQIPATKPS